ncbi:MAG: hypothetical protein R3246_11640, partial [Acidimicrobiia bacterium]|nr:hypothetical protein [Acidimicrobiia bacterium]
MTATLDRTTEPYVGPRPFGTEEADRFFGRTTEVRALRALLYANRVVVLHAPSGAGKTSMVNAGLFPQLAEDGDFDILPVARVGGMRFDVEVANPFTANVLASWDVVDVDNTGSISEALAAQPRPTTTEGLSSLRLVTLDQFEELFTWYPDRWGQRREFMIEVRDALIADPQLRVLIIIRDDFLGQLDPLLGELGTLSRANLRLDLLRREAALRAVEGPLAQLGVSYGEGVASQLVDELMQIRVQRGTETVVVPGELAEPVQLQVVCDALWRNLPPGVTEITPEHLQTYADIDQALTDFYLHSIGEATEGREMDPERLHTWIAANLVTEAGTRSTVFRGEGETAGMGNDVLQRLEILHVIRGEERLGGRWYELSHDRMLGAVAAVSRRFGGDADRQRLVRMIRWLAIGAVVALLGLVGAVIAYRLAEAD